MLMVQKKPMSNGVNPIRPACQSFARPRGVRGPDAKNQGYHQPIEMKLCMNQYSHESMPDAKFKSGNFSGFVDMTSHNGK